MTFEKIIHYKCKCNTKIHQLAFGENKIQKPLDMNSIKIAKCHDCNGLIKTQMAEQLTIENNQISREIINVDN